MATFGSRSTADQVLEGLDLTGQTILVTGGASGLGLETMRALAARGAHVVATARNETRAAEACAKVKGKTTPVACDQDDFASVAAAAARLRAYKFDAIIANAGVMAPPKPDVRYGVESQFRINHLSHMLLVTRLADRIKPKTGRLVILSSSAAQTMTTLGGIPFDNLDGHAGYWPFPFYGASKLANLCFAKSMAERLADRGITANALHPGVIAGTDLARSMPRWMAPAWSLAKVLGKTVPQGAATQCYLAAHPDVEGVTGKFFADCQPARSNPRADNRKFREKLWQVSEALLEKHAPPE